MKPLAAAVQIATDLGLDVGEPVVLRDVGSYVVHLAPSLVVARIAEAATTDLAALGRELEVVAYLADHGAPVAPPFAEPGPHLADDWVVALWDRVDHDPDRPLDGEAAGRSLREIHDLLAERDVLGLPHFARLDEVRAIVARLEPEPGDAADLEEMVALATAAADRLEVPLQPVHGDAHLGNALRTPAGPVWGDFEKLCLGPRELDLACNEGAARHRGRTPEDDAFLVGYGAHDRDVLARIQPLELVPLTAWTFRLAAEKPGYADLASTRLAWALAGLRSS